MLERLTGARRPVIGSGRTDRGVHALGQVASVDVPTKWSPGELRRAMNALLPAEIWLGGVDPAEPRFHPRFDAVARTYEYRLGTDAGAASPFHCRWCWDVSETPPERRVLEVAAGMIPGERSFRNFAKTGQPQRGERCRVTRAEWVDWCGGPGIRFVITADRYLHHMVRYLVGTMVDVARGRRPLDEMDELLHDPESERVTSPPAPPEGLYLARVEYPESTDEANG